MDNHLNTKESDLLSGINAQRRIMFSFLLTYIHLERFAQLNPDLAKSVPYREMREILYDRSAAFRVAEMIHHGDLEGAYALLVETFPSVMKEYEPMLTRVATFLKFAWLCAKAENPDIPEIECPELTPNND